MPGVPADFLQWDSETPVLPGREHPHTELGRGELRCVDVHRGSTWVPESPGLEGMGALGGPARLSAGAWGGRQQ